MAQLSPQPPPPLSLGLPPRRCWRGLCRRHWRSFCRSCYRRRHWRSFCRCWRGLCRRHWRSFCRSCHIWHGRPGTPPPQQAQQTIHNDYERSCWLRLASRSVKSSDVCRCAPAGSSRSRLLALRARAGWPGPPPDCLLLAAGIFFSVQPRAPCSRAAARASSRGRVPGCCLLAAGCWLLAGGCWLLALLLAAG